MNDKEVSGSSAVNEIYEASTKASVRVMGESFLQCPVAFCWI